jgi:hypothetical protein
MGKKKKELILIKFSIKRLNPVGPSIFKEQKFMQAVNNPSNMDLSKLDSLFAVVKKAQLTPGFYYITDLFLIYF